MTTKKMGEAVACGIKKIQVTVRNKPGSPLVVHAFSEKAKREIRDKQARAGARGRGARDPQADFLAARYLDADGRECVPAAALKKALVSAARASKDLTQVGMRQAFFVSPADTPGGELVPIETHAGEPAVGVRREDAVKIGIDTRDLAYRPEYAEWQLRITIEFDSGIVSEAQLLDLVRKAGWGVGICEGRPERSALGWGRFELVQ